MARTDRSANALAIAASAASVVLTVAAFCLSYANLHGVAAGHGLHHATVRAWAWPATIDLFIVIGELLIVRAAVTGRRDGWAVALTVLGSIASIALNVSGAGGNAPFLDYVVDAVPPIGALLAFGALMRQVHGYITTHGAAPETGETPAVPAETPAPVIEPAAPVQVQAVPAQVAPPVQVTVPVEQPALVPAAHRETNDFPAGLLTTRELMDARGVSRATLNRWIKAGRLTPVLKDPSAGNLFDPSQLD